MKNKTERKCKWCGAKYDASRESESFCSSNPNAEKYKKLYFDGSPLFRRIRRNRKKNSVVRIACLVLPQRQFPK